MLVFHIKVLDYFQGETWILKTFGDHFKDVLEALDYERKDLSKYKFMEKLVFSKEISKNLIFF